MKAAIPAGVALLLAVGGCLGGPRPGSGPEPGPTVPRTTTAAERSLLYKAEQELQRACMTAAGFRFWTVPENPLPEARDFPYVVDDPDWARQYGYGGVLQERIERLRTQDPNQVYLRGLPEERRRAAVATLNGTAREDGLRAELPGGVVIGHSRDGCQVEAWRELYGDVPGWYAAGTLVDNLGGVRRQRVTAEPEFRTAVRAWAACMRQHGQAYEQPADARAAFLGQEGRDTANETRTAVQEARCAHSSGLAGVARRLDRHHDRELRREHRAAFEQMERLRVAALPRARTVLAP